VVTTQWLADVTGRPARTPGQQAGQKTSNETVDVVEPHAIRSPTTKVLIAQHQAIVGPSLLDAVRARAEMGACTFAFVVPGAAQTHDRAIDSPPSRGKTRQRLDDALSALERAAGTKVRGIVGDETLLTAVEDAVNLYGFDEIIICVAQTRLARWLRLDLPSKLTGLGLPTTTVILDTDLG